MTYEKPVVHDYGDVAEMTAGALVVAGTDCGSASNDSCSVNVKVDIL